MPESQFVGLVGHHTVMVMGDYDHDGMTDGDLDDIKSYMRQLQTARPDLGNEVPYSFVVFPGADPADSVVAEGRGRGRTGAHTIDYNSTRYGVAYAGNASVDSITPGVIDGYRWVGATMLVDPIGAKPTFGHRDVYPTECPGNRLYPRLPQPPFTLTKPDPIPDFSASLGGNMLIIGTSKSGANLNVVLYPGGGYETVSLAGKNKTPWVGPTLGTNDNRLNAAKTAAAIKASWPWWRRVLKTTPA